MEKVDFMETILVSITGKDEIACIEKINEVNNLDVKKWVYF